MNYKLYNADCVEILTQLESNSINMLLTDIPYGEATTHSAGLRNLDYGIADICNIDLHLLIQEAIRVVSGSFYVFCGTKQLSKIISIFEEFDLTTRLGVWEKTNPSPMNGDKLWISGLEYCVFARKSKATFTVHCKAPIWKYPKGTNEHHPTQKPIKLMEELVLASTNPGDTVLDVCMGSGTTGIACARTGRQFVGIELDTDYYMTAENRIYEEFFKNRLFNYE